MSAKNLLFTLVAIIVFMALLAVWLFALSGVLFGWADGPASTKLLAVGLMIISSGLIVLLFRFLKTKDVLRGTHK